MNNGNDTQATTSFAKRFRNELGLIVALVIVIGGTIGANLLMNGSADYLKP